MAFAVAALANDDDHFPLAALIAIIATVPLIQSPQPEPAESAQRTAQTNQNSNSAKQSGFRSYINLTSGYCTSERPNSQSEWRKKFICESKITDVVIVGVSTEMTWAEGGNDAD